MQSSIIQSSNLYFSDGRSDKLYNAVIVEADSGYFVNFEYGRRGSTLRQGSKTTKPVELEKAKNLFKGLVKSKCSKGYAPLDEVNTTCAIRAQGSIENSPYSPQLLNPIGDEQLQALLHNPLYLAQEKHDGERRLIEKEDGEIRGINKKGQYITLNSSLERCSEEAKGMFVLDGEDMGDYIVVFDLLKQNGIDLRSLPLVERLARLSAMNIFKGSIRFSTPAYSVDEKVRLLEKVKDESGEGIVFKRIDAPYESGRPNSGGGQLKYKLYATASCVVLRHNTKRSVEMGLIDSNGNLTSVGNVSIPANMSIPDEMSVIEVRYLYAYLGGCIYQPTFKEQRNDVEQHECLMSQLKYKP